MSRVAIVGFAPSHVDTPWTDPDLQIWTMNYHHTQVPRSDRIFEIHDWDYLQKEDGGAHLRQLATVTVPVYMQDQHDQVPTSVAYPIAEMTALYLMPEAEKPYFTNTASYMIALAIAEGFTQIELYGVDMANDSEYAYQRPSCEFFLGIAVGKGIRVLTHRLSDLLKTAYVYGYEEKQQVWMRDKLKVRLDYLHHLHNTHLRQLEETKKAVYEVQGAIQNQEHIVKVWT